MSSSMFKLLLIGNGHTGKTTYVTMLQGGEWSPHYVATLGVKVGNVTLMDTIFNIWDIAGQGALVGFKDGYYTKSKCCIIFFDSTTMESIPHHLSEVKTICGDIPIVLVKNKSSDHECRTHLVIDDISYPIFQISCKESLNLLEPLRYLREVLVRDHTC